jgi:ubiquinone/menaquinone biosynthesis C-methylase UbiE
MAEHICPWWMGYLLASPLRRWLQDPHAILSPYVQEGMTILEPGPGMGFFTIELARLVGPNGKVIAVDIQPQMLAALGKRARKAGVADRIVLVQAKNDSLNIDSYMNKVDLVLAFAVVHELPSIPAFFKEAAAALKTGGKLYLAEPAGHVKPDAWTKTLQIAQDSGLRVDAPLQVRKSHAALLVK